ncbi:hypothetical protein KEF85_15995 [Methylomonas paludis]|uniref:Peptidase S1 domain-containing protein n=1 Tax=Methylomonas paludis TaxID=1173101 RepID=A0A975MNX0_9GAMM|nr:hypothetical protein [Methylomonas paludis]QWF70794.1 hypothetical protein KEF85_15995 [Methylomonas paludis]
MGVNFNILLIASSVVIQVFSRTFLITASHVINQIKIAVSPFYMAIDGSFVNLVGNFFHSISQGKKDHFDIAFIELSNEFVAKNNINILCEDRLMINRYFNSVHLSLIHGYPCSKNKQGKALKGGTTFNLFYFTYGGKVDKNFTNWDKYKKNNDVHICMNYGQAIDINGEINNPPSPRGISGGGLWYVPNSFFPDNLYLAGIFIEYYQNDRISFSTKIDKVVEFIKTNI